MKSQSWGSGRSCPPATLLSALWLHQHFPARRPLRAHPNLTLVISTSGKHISSLHWLLFRVLFFFFFSFQSSYEYEEQRHILSFLPFSIRCVTPIILSGTILLPFLHCASFGSNAFCLLTDDHYEKVRVLWSTDLAYLFTTASPMPRVLSVIWWLVGLPRWR